jgi:CheY-like chemotaxis protein
VLLDLPPDLWAVEADQGQISQVLQNLVINAHQATRSGGTVAVRAQNCRMERSENPRLQPGQYVRVTVEDEGVGIAAEDLEHIFEPYFTRKSGGNGLGLAVVYSIVAKHEGLIEVESTAGKGARFDVYLPASELAWEESPAASPPARAEGGRLLLMDDDDLVREAAAELFSHLGYEVTTTRDGKEALERHDEALRAGAPFDLAVLDLTVPGGMGGEETARLLRDKECEALLVASSGYSTAGALADYRARGFDQILSKPYRFEDVLHTFASLTPLRQARSTCRGPMAST